MTSEIILLILALASGFYMAWNIGANDVANAMGTSVGSGALRLKQAIYIAAILEFSGAFFFGSHVSETMQSGIINPSLFAGEPRVLLLGMLSALIGTGIWLQIASYFGWPVSATHAIVGAIVGFGLLIGGLEGVYWEEVGFIASSWVLSPLLGGILGYYLFNIIRKRVFHAIHPLQAAQRLIPFLVFAMFISLILLLMYNSLENVHFDLDFIETLLISLVAAISIALLSHLIIKKYIKSASKVKFTPSKAATSQLEAARYQLEQAKLLSKRDAQDPMSDIIEDLEATVASFDHSDEFDHTKTDFETIEKMFGWLQILSACLMAFAHGANDVANAIGPLSAALFILKTGAVPVATVIPSWALALGGAGIVVGLATWGWRVIETIGKKLTELTPTRGFAAELGAAMTILFASRLGLPISTTHTLVGAVIGVGLARGIEALNLGMTRAIIGSWIITIPIGALSATIIYTLFDYLF